ncbi:MAG: sulfite exporter TauE/SafE family protein [candidate division Zixibacteria bacterium]|nr:sulfite exporter TauE/SafE family protein [candidate division Zixibacteria bacterium]
MIHFPISGVETYWWLPLVVAFVISCLSSVGGLSGAFLLLPFQISFLGFTGPAVSPTNLTYNIVSIPSGVYRYYHERRMVWPLAWVTIAGTLPGVFIGAVIRVKFLPDPKSFKPFVGLVLLYIAVRLLRDVLTRKTIKVSSPRVKQDQFRVQSLAFNLKQIGYKFNGRSYFASTGGILLMSFLVGIIGGTYGIGGGAIIAPFFVTVFGLPVYTVAGAALLGTLVTSVAGVGFYMLMASFYADGGFSIAPDWLLGGMFGLGGAAGMYVGARLQRYLPARLIKVILIILMLTVAFRYLIPLLQ